MPRTRKKARSSSLDSDGAYAPPASVRHPRITVKPREQRVRRAPSPFSPTVDSSPRKSRKLKDPSPETDNIAPPTPSRPEHQRLANKIKSQAHRLRYPLAFIEAYEAEGWRKSSRDKLKPNKEIEAEHCKILKGQQALIEGLRELKALSADHPQVPPLAVFEDVHCSLCASTEIESDNDILLCDSIGCHRAYHQRCQTPIVLTAKIPAGIEPWFCEVCLAVFECLKSINSVFGTEYESVDDLFPELTQQTATDLNSRAQLGEESLVDAVLDEEEEDEDFVYTEEEDEEEVDHTNDQTSEEAVEEMAEEVPESAQDLLFLCKDDVIDPNQRSTRSKSAIQPLKPSFKRPTLVGEPAAKINQETGQVVLGVVAELEPPTKGRYSRWRIDYHDGSSELLTRSKTEAAINRAAVEDSDEEQSGNGSEADSTLIVRGKRKRNDVDYRQLNELMFAGKDEDSEDDETFEVKEESEEEPEEEEDEEEEGEVEAEDLLAQSSSSIVTTKQNEELNFPPVDVNSMNEGMNSKEK